MYALWEAAESYSKHFNKQSLVVIANSLGWLCWNILGFYWFLEIGLYQASELFCVWLSEISFCQNVNVLAKQKFFDMNLVNRM